MVYLLMTYDLEFHEGQKRPESGLFETQNLPSHEATISLRKGEFEGSDVRFGVGAGVRN